MPGTGGVVIDSVAELAVAVVGPGVEDELVVNVDTDTVVGEGTEGIVTGLPEANVAGSAHTPAHAGVGSDGLTGAVTGPVGAPDVLDVTIPVVEAGAVFLGIADEGFAGSGVVVEGGGQGGYVLIVAGLTMRNLASVGCNRVYLVGIFTEPTGWGRAIHVSGTVGVVVVGDGAEAGGVGGGMRHVLAWQAGGRVFIPFGVGGKSKQPGAGGAEGGTNGGANHDLVAAQVGRAVREGNEVRFAVTRGVGQGGFEGGRVPAGEALDEGAGSKRAGRAGQLVDIGAGAVLVQDDGVVSHSLVIRTVHCLSCLIPTKTLLEANSLVI